MSVETLPSSEALKTYEKLAVLRHEIEFEGDEAVAGKLTELFDKIRNGEFVIGFCGHFSAGKSTMINRIAGVDLLPSNPIPTSANLAKIRNNKKAFARIDYTNEDSVEMPYPYDLQEIRRSAIDGKVRSIEIAHPLEGFSTGVTLLDTPGIDSTDEAHLAATESALHLADIIFYVTDYNHVLSELNLAFLKQLQSQNKRVVLIVNQIDKHLSSELDFDDYRNGIARSFKEHDIEPEHIFYTSLKNGDLRENQFAQLKSFLLTVSSEKDRTIDVNAVSAAKQLVEEHLDWMLENSREEREELENGLSGLSDEERLSIRTRYKELTNELQELSEKPVRLVEQGRERVNETLASAILMPYETREAGRSYVESIQPDFKIGLFGAKKKTEQEREQRLNQFYQKVKETSSALDWQIKELLAKLADAFNVSDEAFKQSIYEMKATFSPQLLSDQLQQGATFNADYVLRYTEKAADAIKHLYRRMAFDKLDEAAAILKQASLDQVEQIEQSLAEMGDKIEALKGLNRVDEALAKEREHLLAVLDGEIDASQLQDALTSLPKERQHRIVKQTEATSGREPEIAKKTERNQDVAAAGEAQKVQVKEDFRKRLLSTASQLRESANLIQPLKGFQTTTKEMLDRAERLENNRFTVALFGAFSAGKSSFANALIGENALPVSPNPTTAAINQILPVDRSHPHKTAVIHIKEESEMLDDVREALKSTEVTIDRLGELPSLLRQLENVPFLQAVASGYEAFIDIMGTEQTVDFATFNEMVSVESKAVFVESIELYYDCPLTRQGITLVDTPGADSINARHTDVAFDYIKNADAILFVTYYNHAFSRADREFLIQLGRVKDSFAMDKMFFIVNAADLADSDEELDAVVNYVEKNLQAYGVRHPRIYPISSKQALTDNKPNSGFPEFEAAFQHFTMDELTNVAVQAAQEEAGRVVRTLGHFLASALEDETVRLRKYEAAAETKQAVEELIEQAGTMSDIQALSQEIDQLLYYIEQRVFLRYPDLFKEIFNPGTLGGSGTVKKDTLQNCLKELIQVFGFDLAQEMRATSLRTEKFANGLLKDQLVKISGEVSALAPDYSFSSYESVPFETPRFENGLEDLDLGSFACIIGLYKNTKQFFERGGRTEMRDRLQERLKQPVADYLRINGERLKTIFIENYQGKAGQLKERMLNEAREYSDGKLAALTVEIDAGQLERTKKAIEAIWQLKNP